MDEFRRGQADQLHGKAVECIPDFFPAAKQFFVNFSFCRFFIVLLQRGLAGKRVEKISVKADPRFFVDEFSKFIFIRLSVRADQSIQSLQKPGIKNYCPRIQIHVPMSIYRAQRTQPFFALLVQKLPHIIVPVIQEYAVLLSCLHIFLHGNGRRSLRIEIDLQGVEQKKHIPGKHQHSFRNPGWYS